MEISEFQVTNKNHSAFWHRLISYWVNIKKKNGLTIPFIIGAEQFDKKDYVFKPKDVSELLLEIRNSSLNDTLTLLYCDNIGDYVLGLNNPDKPMIGTDIKNEQTNKTTLIATFSTQILGSNIDDITNSLAKKYSKCLKDKKYSLINLQWTDFNESDIKMIKEALVT